MEFPDIETKAASLFLDKRILSALTINKEGELIGEFNALINLIKDRKIKQEKITESLEFLTCWQLLNDLFAFLEFNKIEELKDQLKTEYKFLKEILYKYNSLDGGVSFEELHSAYNALRKFVSLAGYHDDKTRGSSNEYDED